MAQVEISSKLNASLSASKHSVKCDERPLEGGGVKYLELLRQARHSVIFGDSHLCPACGQEPREIRVVHRGDRGSRTEYEHHSGEVHSFEVAVGDPIQWPPK